MIVSLWRNLRRLSGGKKSTSFFTFSLTYCKDIANLLFWVLWACLAMYILSDTIVFMFNFYVYLEAKNKTPSFMLLWRYCKDMQTYFEYFGQAWLYSPKMIVLTCDFDIYLHAKNNLIIHLFLKILWFKESWNLIRWQHLGP